MLRATLHLLGYLYHKEPFFIELSSQQLNCTVASHRFLYLHRKCPELHPSRLDHPPHIWIVLLAHYAELFSDICHLHHKYRVPLICSSRLLLDIVHLHHSHLRDQMPTL